MIQQVNLYLPEFRPNREYISAIRVLQLAGFVVFVMAVMSANSFLKTRTLRADIQATQSQLAAQTVITSQLQQDLARRSSDPALVEELADREQGIAESREMLEFLRGTNLGNISGFSEYVKDLSRASFDGLWLTEFNLLNGGENVYLKGIAQQSAMVPDFINRLSAGKSPLTERDFSRFLGNLINTTPVEGLERTRLYQFELETRE
jgi:cell division protein FtsB